jgi:Nickel responsive protein SCO4226-like
MPQYMVERHLPGITPEQLAGAAARAKTVTAEMTNKGKPVRYLRTTFVPSEDKAFCLFDAPSAERVREANELAQIPVQRITEVKHIAAEDVN